MKKLLIFLSFFLTLSLSGQLYPGVVSSQGVSVGGYCAEYQAVYDWFDTKPSDAVAVYQNAMVYSLDSAGFWDRSDAMWVYAVHEEDDESLGNWISPGTYTADNVSATSWTQYEGYTGDNSADYISSNFHIRNNTSNYTQNDASLIYYVRTSSADASPVVGVYDNVNYLTIATPTGSPSNRVFRINEGSTGTTISSSDTWVGTIAITRRGANETEYYVKGTSVGTGATASTALPDNELRTLSYQSSSWSNLQVSIVLVMDGITDAEAVIINTIFNRYMTSLGKQV